MTSFQIDPQVLEALYEISDKEHRTLASVLRQAVAEFLASQGEREVQGE